MGSNPDIILGPEQREVSLGHIKGAVSVVQAKKELRRAGREFRVAVVILLIVIIEIVFAEEVRVR